MTANALRPSCLERACVMSLWRSISSQRERFIRGKERISDEVFAFQVNCREQRADFAIAARNVIARICRIDPGFIHPSDHVHQIESMMYYSWLHDENGTFSELGVTLEFELALNRHLTGLRLPPFTDRDAPEEESRFLTFGQWSAEAALRLEEFLRKGALGCQEGR